MKDLVEWNLLLIRAVTEHLLYCNAAKPKPESMLQGACLLAMPYLNYRTVHRGSTLYVHTVCRAMTEATGVDHNYIMLLGDSYLLLNLVIQAKGKPA